MPMHYIGSKFKLADWIEHEITYTVGNELSQKVFCDLFAGTGIIGRRFKKNVKKVISNDIEYYSYILNKNYIQNNQKNPNQKKLLYELNNLELITNGFIYQNYCKGSGSNRQYFTDENGQKIDTIRTAIQKLKNTHTINDQEYYFLLASLLESADKVANTASVYGSFLKHIKKTAQEPLELQASEFTKSINTHEVYNEDANELIHSINGDVLYLDPPYNKREYGAYYHLLNTISLYDNFIPQGKTGLRDYKRSPYCKSKAVYTSFEDLIKHAQFKYIFLSYNSEGLMSIEDIENIMSKYGKYTLITKKYKRFKADKTMKQHKQLCEYLHVLIK